MGYSAIGTGSTLEGTLHPISHGIHSLVQPLTAAQCLLEFTLHKGGTAADYRASIEKALSELRRISDSITFVRELIRIQQDGSDVITFSLKPAVRNVIVELQPVLDEAGVQVYMSETDSDPTITMSPMRLRQALFYQLQAAQLSCAPGEALRIEINTIEDTAELRIERTSQPVGQNSAREAEPGTSDRIAQALHLAEAIMTKAGGELEFSEVPLSLVAQFPCNADGGALDYDKARARSVSAES
jgi:hypothetical protein